MYARSDFLSPHDCKAVYESNHSWSERQLVSSEPGLSDALAACVVIEYQGLTMHMLFAFACMVCM